MFVYTGDETDFIIKCDQYISDPLRLYNLGHLKYLDSNSHYL
jgi:hypothetical protein